MLINTLLLKHDRNVIEKSDQTKDHPIISSTFSNYI